jgi:hypothetical protein
MTARPAPGSPPHEGKGPWGNHGFPHEQKEGV